MKPLNYLMLSAAALLLGAAPAPGQSFGGMGVFGEADTRTVLTVKPDGSGTWTNEVVEPRKLLEMQITSWERYAKMREGIDSGDDEPAVVPAQPPKPPEAKPLTSEELTAKIREMYAERLDGGDEDGAAKVEAVEVSTNSVRLVTSRTFASLKELLGQSPFSWGPTILMFDEARLETDTNQNLRLTFTPSTGATRYGRSMSREWKSTKMKYEWKLVLPGKILNSGLPQTAQNATWLNIDPEKPETADAAIKLVGAPLVITAESAGLKLAEPLESKLLTRAARGPRNSEPDVPITDATPGFLAEPAGLTLATVHYFPEGGKYVQDHPEAMYGLGSNGVLVSAKIFPPKGRTIKSVSDARVKSAKDDQGRPITPRAGEAGDEESYSYTSFSSGSEEGGKGGAVRIELHLSLPAGDAKSIDELQGEAVALTIGGWKEMVLTNIQADAKKEIDLGEVLPGAKLIIQKIGGGKQQRTIQATLQGSNTVSQLEVKIKTTGRMGSSSNTSDRRSKKTGDKTTRDITIQSYEFNMNGEAAGGPINLLVRFPQDVKRERVQFKLTALDLL